MTFPAHAAQFSLSTRTSPLLPLSVLARIASEAGLGAVDLDLTGRPSPGGARRWLQEKPRPEVRVASVWVPRPGVWTGWSHRRCNDVAIALTRSAEARVLVVDLPTGVETRLNRSRVIEMVESMRQLLDPPTRIALGLRSRQLVGGRIHLVQMTALRRMAEEWDFGIALDLVGDLDQRWEAEAAVTRLGRRLWLIRLCCSAGSDSSAWRRPSARALAAVLDAGRLPMLALVPTVARWQTVLPRALVTACTSDARRIAARCAALEEGRVSRSTQNAPFGGLE